VIDPQLITGLVRLQEGERITLATRPDVLITWPFYLMTLGLYSFWRKRTAYVLTDRRLIARKGIINKSERSLPIVKVQDASVRSQLWQGFLLISTAGGTAGQERLGPFRAADARIMADAVLAMTHHANQAPLAPQVAAAPDLADQLGRLAALRDQGVLSDDEFAAQKAKLLA